MRRTRKDKGTEQSLSANPPSPFPHTTTIIIKKIQRWNEVESCKETCKTTRLILDGKLICIHWKLAYKFGSDERIMDGGETETTTITLGVFPNFPP